MINLGHQGLDSLPEETKDRICEIFAAYYRLDPNNLVVDIIIWGYYMKTLNQALDDLSKWQSFLITSTLDEITQKLEHYLHNTMGVDKQLDEWGILPERRQQIGKWRRELKDLEKTH